MTTHIMSFTYEPKIPRVWSGDITQTIRKKGKREKKVGDKILFHTWTGRPYRSKWGKRLLVEITEILNIRVFEDYMEDNYGPIRWDHPRINLIAIWDGIEPPTGPELKRLLFDLNKSKDGDEYQIIRWKVLE